MTTPKPDDDNRRSPYTLNVRVTVEEMAEIKRRAKACGMSVSEYVRAVALA